MHAGSLDKSSAMATELCYYLSIDLNCVFGFIRDVLPLGHGFLLFFGHFANLEAGSLVKTMVDTGLPILFLGIGTRGIATHVVRGFTVPALVASTGVTTSTFMMLFELGLFIDTCQVCLVNWFLSGTIL